MKKQYCIYGLFAAALTLGACDYNEDNFPGFDELAHPQHVWSDTITLAANDYKNVAELKANQDLALSKDPEGGSYEAALKAVSSNKFFTEDAPAAWYLPAFIAQKYPYMDNKSKVTVHYSEFANLPDYVTKLAGAKNYTLDSDDYKVVWGEGQNVSFISPSTKGKIVEALNAGISKPKDGEVRVVSYAWSDTEPSFGGGGGTQEPEVNYTPINQIASEGKYTAKGTVIAANAKSFIIQDGTGMMRVYRGYLPTVSLGDVVELDGDVEAKQGLYRFRAKANVKYLERAAEFAYPEAKKVDADYFTNYGKNVTMEYVTFEAKLVKSGKNNNLIIEGTTMQPSPTDALFLDESYYDQQVEVTGYMAGLSGTSYPNVFVTSIVKKGEANSLTPIGAVQYVEAGKEYSVRGVVTAVNQKSFMLADGTGNVLVYLNELPEFVVGDVVTVTGEANKRDGAIQLKNISAKSKNGMNETAVKSMVAPTITPEEFDAWVAVPRVAHFSISGKMSISDNPKGGYYFNVLPGSANSISLTYVDDKKIDMSLNDKNVVLTGYIQGQPYNGRVSVIYTDVKEAAAASVFGLTRAAVTPNTSVLYAYNGEAKTWELFKESGVDVSVLQPSDYDQMGSSYVSKPAESLPIYLAKNYPYAKPDDVAAVVYANDKNDSDKLSATEFKFDGSAWVMTSEASPAMMTFQKAEGEWIEARVYLEASFDGSDGGFKPDDILLPGNSSYVWKLDKFGYWKGSGFVGGNKAAESYLVSPELDLSKASMPVLVFDCAINFLAGNELKDFFNLVVAEDYTEGKAAEASWKKLQVQGWPEGTSWDFSTVEPIDLTQFAGKKIRIAFHYKSTDSAAPTVEIKNLSVKE